jgi:hypothetical protein
MKLETWTCDFEGCKEIAQWYRRSKGQIFKLCTKHEAILAKQHWGRRVDYSVLCEDDMRRLRTKVYWGEYHKEHPFEVVHSRLEDRWKVRISDVQTGEHCSFTLKDSDMKKFLDNYNKIEEQGFVPKPSIDEYVSKLKEGMSST